MISVRDSCSTGEVARCPKALSAAACAALRKAVDERRSLTKDTVDLAPEHQRTITPVKANPRIGNGCNLAHDFGGFAYLPIGTVAPANHGAEQ